MKEELGEFLSTMGLTLSEEKTKVTHITEGFDFLGYRVIRSRGTKRKDGPKGTYTRKGHQDDFARKYAECLPLIPPKSQSRLKIQRLNWLTRGWCEYYRSTSSPSRAFRQIDTRTVLGLRTLARSKVREQHASNNATIPQG